MEEADYEILPFPSDRRTVVDAGRLASRRHIIHALIEVDVTQARKLLRIAKASGSNISFTAFVVACLSQAIVSARGVQAYRDWRGRLVLFDDVDVVTMIEPEAGAVAIPHIVRAANRKTVRQISDEVRSVQTRPESSQQKGGLVALGQRVPWLVRRPFYWALRKNPHWFKQAAGTVIVTSVGMFGQGGGWGLTFLPMHTLGLTMGGIARKPGLHDGEIAIREILDLTISLDHDIVDGAPAARFVHTLRDLIEKATILEENRFIANG